MKKMLLGIVLLTTALSCTLNGEQERTLNAALSAHLTAHNEGKTMTFIAGNHPDVVKYYHDKGDSSFKSRFELTGTNRDPDFWQDPIVKQIEKREHAIHVAYEVSVFSYPDPAPTTMILIALSENNGKSWCFIENKDYFNDLIYEPDKRLITRF